MKVVSYKAIRDFVAIHPAALPALRHWHATTKYAAWQNIREVRADFPHADLVGRRTVFNVGGNAYRIIARINYTAQKVFVLHILTHAEYNKEKWK